MQTQCIIDYFVYMAYKASYMCEYVIQKDWGVELMKHHIPYIRNTHLNLPRENPKTQYDIKKCVYTLFVCIYI